MIKKKLRLEHLEQRCLLTASPIITEFSGFNRDLLYDANAESSDWIEIFNPGDQQVHLTGYRLTDDSDDLTKWIFPSTSLEPGEFLTLFASGNDVPDAQGSLHTNFARSG